MRAVFKLGLILAAAGLALTPLPRHVVERDVLARCLFNGSAQAHRAEQQHAVRVVRRARAADNRRNARAVGRAYRSPASPKRRSCEGGHARRPRHRHRGDRRCPVFVVSWRVGAELSAAAASRAARFPRRADHSRCVACPGGSNRRFAECAARRRARGRMAGSCEHAGRPRAGVSSRPARPRAAVDRARRTSEAHALQLLFHACVD